MNIDLCWADLLFRFIDGFSYTFVFHNRFEFASYHKIETKHSLRNITDPNIIAIAKYNIVICSSENIVQVLSNFPKISSLFISPQCGDNNIYDDSTFGHLTNLTDFWWPNRPNLERTVHENILHRVFAAGYAKRLCDLCDNTNRLKPTISNLFFAQPTFDICLLKLIFDYAA